MLTPANLTPAQARVAAALASGFTVTRIAEELKLSRQTIYTWRKTIPQFETAVQQAAAEYAHSVRDALQEHTIAAINTLGTLMRDPDTPPSIRVKIALAFLNRPQFPAQGWNMPVPIEQDPIKKRTSEILEQMEAHLKASQLQQEINHIEVERRVAAASLDKTGHKTEQPEVSTPRSAPCPCGSGQKYKRCCGHNAPPVLSKAAA